MQAGRQVDRTVPTAGLFTALYRTTILFSVSWLWSFILSVKPLEGPIRNLCWYISPIWMLKHSFVRFTQTQTCFQHSAFLCAGATAPQLVQLTWWNAAGAWVWLISGPFPVFHSPNADGFQAVFMPMQSTVFALYVDCLPAHNQISNMIGQHSKQKKQDIIDITSLWYIKLYTDIISGLVKHSVMLHALCMSSSKKSDVSYKNKSDDSELPLTGLLPCKRTRIQTMAA